MEARFLELVRNNDVVEVSTVLSEENVSPDIFPDLGTLRDEFGRSALELAVDSGSREVAEVLLDHGAPIGDALLYAIDRQDTGAVRILKEKALSESLGRTYGVDPEIGSSAFPSYMTPVMLAALRNNYPILKMLLQAGFPTSAPDDYKWTTDTSESIAWMDAYRAVCSPSHILLTSPDPFHTAFRTAKALRDVVWKREQNRPELEQLADRCETFAGELLNEARTTKETGAILEHLCSPEDSPYRKSVSTLQLAVDLKLTKFATHPLCFDYVNQRKFQELSDFSQFFQGWETMSSVYAMLSSTAIGLAYPLLCLTHLLAPQSKIGKFSSLSVIRAMYWTWSWLVLLILLLLESQAYRLGPSEIDSIIQGTPASTEPVSGTTILIMIWVIDVASKDLQEVRREGLMSHFKQFWNILDFLMVAVYLAHFALRMVAFFKLDAYTEQGTVADDWAHKANEIRFQPIAVADVLFSIFTIIVFMRTVSLFMYYRFLGMLLISIGRMTVDIMKFIVMGGLILFAFACGLNQLYWFYGTMHQYLCSKLSESNLQALSCSKAQGFDTLFNSLQSLSWAGFGVVDLSLLDLHPGTSPVNVFQIQEWPVITETAGKLVFGLFEVIGVLVLVNLLIAIMSDSYTRTEEVKRIDWGFIVMKDMLHYLKVDVSLPPPFTLIMSVRNALVRPVLALCGRRNNPPDTDTNVERAVHPSQSPLPAKQDVYKLIVGRLITRYLLRKERGLD
ncbi:TRPC5 [Branchiostoma lanceolatum]|uniref:TRPC5 protein n=1 Tax=Branchiostoma lanceolatum TaxID=7740 RepID=A0A8J9ZYI7_BRALA|nr:TRPC5 [Branchiostoma lanceolatum]